MAIVTVSIPTYNRCTYLRQAIQSVQQQTFRDFKLLVSDNGSTDDTREIVASYAKADARIVYNRFSENRGLAYNYKYAFMGPETEFVAILPDDDLWLPHHLASAMDAFQSVPNAVLYGCTARFFGKPSGHDFHRPSWVNGCTSRQILDTTKRFVPWLKESPLPPASVVFRTSARNHITWYSDDTFGPMDWLFGGQMALTGVTVFEPTVGVKLRWHEGNQSHVLLKGKRASAQFRYVMRSLATSGLAKGAFTTADLVQEVVQSWSLGAAANLVVALGAYDANASLRRAAFEIFQQRPELGKSLESTKHCRFASRAGVWYLGLADMVDRLIGRWWRPA
ncbi:MAG: glycosyltransferase [Verrucomicrobia bacterium]|nr:glycosyltransferase [Verrucomicrobiota bacterium]